MSGDPVGRDLEVAALGAVSLLLFEPAMFDGCPQPVPARISFIANQAEYTPPVIYSREQRSRLVFLVEAYPAVPDAARLHVGLPVDVRREAQAR